MISNFYQYKEKKTKFYNLKLYESFEENDNRKKLIPIIIKNYKKNKSTIIVSKNLELNIIHVDDIINAISKRDTATAIDKMEYHNTMALKRAMGPPYF